MARRRIMAVLAGLALLAGLGQAQMTVVGTNTFPTDVNNVQAAVMVPGATVFLKGVFNFGNPDDPATRGQVVLSAPGVTLHGCPGATIRGGYYPLTTIATPDGVVPAIAKNLTILNIRFEGWLGFAVYHMGVQDEDNVTRIEGNIFINTRWPATDSYGIHYCTGGGKAVIRKNKLVGISMLAISTHALNVHKDDYLIIEGNEIVDAHYDPVVVELSDPFAGDPENGPVIIRHNKIGISPEVINPWICLIDLGFWYVSGISNALIEGNVLSGYACFGIATWSYGHGRRIVNNDLSGLTVFASQIITWGHGDLIAGNKLGPVDTSFGTPFSAGIWLNAENYAVYGYPVPEPDKVTKNTLLFNDFRLTGLPGWTLDAANGINSSGCVLLLSGVDMGWYEYWPGCEVTGNLVMEFGKFPAGTGGPAAQVLEYPIHAHDNWIFGRGFPWATPDMAAGPRLTTSLKAGAAAIANGLAQKRAFIEKVKKEIERR